jgi:hypothetical protein
MKLHALKKRQLQLLEAYIKAHMELHAINERQLLETSASAAALQLSSSSSPPVQRIFKDM